MTRNQIIEQMLPSVYKLIDSTVLSPAKAQGYESVSFSSEIEGTNARKSVRMRIFYEMFMERIAKHYTELGYKTRLDPKKYYIYFYWGEAAKFEEAIERNGPSFKSVTRSSDL